MNEYLRIFIANLVIDRQHVAIGNEQIREIRSGNFDAKEIGTPDHEVGGPT